MKDWDGYPDEKERPPFVAVLREAMAADLDEIVRAWPKDFGRLGQDAHRLRQTLQDRLDSRVPCFVAAQERRIVAAVWCKPWLREEALPQNLRGVPSYEVTSLFTVPEARGRGLAQRLLLWAMDRMAERGKTRAYSHILPERVTSIAVHERVGFKKVGMMTFSRRFGRRISRLDTTLIDPRGKATGTYPRHGQE